MRLRAILCVCTITAASLTLAGTPRSASYSFNYATTSLGGGISSSASYELVAITDDNGSPSISSSATYQMEPAVGAPSSPRAAVKTWAIYE